MNSKKVLFIIFICALTVTGCDTQEQTTIDSGLTLIRATQTLDSLYANYSVSGTCLLRENYPSNVGNYTATYLASEERENLVFMLWGSYAKEKASLIDTDKHLILTAVHPSPRSADYGFFGCKHFSKANTFLRSCFSSDYCPNQCFVMGGTGSRSNKYSL
jgi:hypothetical protein